MRKKKTKTLCINQIVNFGDSSGGIFPTLKRDSYFARTIFAYKLEIYVWYWNQNKQTLPMVNRIIVLRVECFEIIQIYKIYKFTNFKIYNFTQIYRLTNLHFTP